MVHSLEQRIRMKAYEIWLREGCPEGSEARHWEMARRFIAGEEVKSTLTSRFFDVHDMNAGVSEPEEVPASVRGKASKARKARAH
jgi:hypothetical protein